MICISADTHISIFRSRDHMSFYPEDDEIPFNLILLVSSYYRTPFSINAVLVGPIEVNNTCVEWNVFMQEVFLYFLFVKSQKRKRD